MGVPVEPVTRVKICEISSAGGKQFCIPLPEDIIKGLYGTGFPANAPAYVNLQLEPSTATSGPLLHVYVGKGTGTNVELILHPDSLGAASGRRPLIPIPNEKMFKALRLSPASSFDLHVNPGVYEIFGGTEHEDRPPSLLVIPIPA
jgi:hypothetical protein